MFTTRIIFRLIDAVLGFVEILIALRILLKFLGANSATPFVSWVYETSRPLLAPFLGMFPSPIITGGFVVEISALFALIVYGFVASLIEEALEQMRANAIEREYRKSRKYRD